MKAIASGVGIAMLLTGLFLPSLMADNEAVNRHITLAFMILIPSSLAILATCGFATGVDTLAERFAYAGHKRRMRAIRREIAEEFRARIELRERERRASRRAAR